MSKKNIFRKWRQFSSAATYIVALCCVFPVYGDLLINDTPTTIIQGNSSRLNQPEGVVFSLSDECIAVANALGNTISIYKRIGDGGSLYENEPSFIIDDKDNFNYPHDVKYTPNGKYLGVISRWNSTAAIYRTKNSSGSSFSTKPSWKLKGSSSKLNHPASLDFSPSGNILVICNRRGSITFHKKKSHKSGEYHQSPYQEITQRQLLKYGISNPHGVAFSPDGNTIATVHKKYFMNPASDGQSALVIFEKSSPNSTNFNPAPSFVSYAGTKGLHSIAFHPSGNYLAVSDGISDVYIYQRSEGNEFVLVHTIKVPGETPEDEGPKGMAFSRSGDCLAVTVVSPYQVHIYDVQEVD